MHFIVAVVSNPTKPGKIGIISILQMGGSSSEKLSTLPRVTWIINEQSLTTWPNFKAQAPEQELRRFCYEEPGSEYFQLCS